MKNTESSSRMNTLGCYQQNLQFCALSPRQSGRKPAGIFCMPSIPKHCGKIFPSFFFFPKLPVFQTVNDCWQYVSECLDVSRPVCANVLQGENYFFFSEDKNFRVSVLTFSVQNFCCWQVLNRLWVYLKILQLFLGLSKCPTLASPTPPQNYWGDFNLFQFAVKCRIWESFEHTCASLLFACALAHMLSCCEVLASLSHRQFSLGLHIMLTLVNAW